MHLAFLWKKYLCVPHLTWCVISNVGQTPRTEIREILSSKFKYMRILRSIVLKQYFDTCVYIAKVQMYLNFVIYIYNVKFKCKNTEKGLHVYFENICMN